MKDRHSIDLGNVDLDKLKANLIARLGHPVEILTSRSASGGELIIEDEQGGKIDVDPSVIASAVANAPVLKSDIDQLLSEFDAASDPDAKLLAIRNYFARLKDKQLAVRRMRDNFRDGIIKANEESTL